MVLLDILLCWRIFMCGLRNGTIISFPWLDQRSHTHPKHFPPLQLIMCFCEWQGTCNAASAHLHYRSAAVAICHHGIFTSIPPFHSGTLKLTGVKTEGLWEVVIRGFRTGEWVELEVKWHAIKGCWCCVPLTAGFKSFWRVITKNVAW